MKEEKQFKVRRIPVQAGFPKILKETRGLTSLDGTSKMQNINGMHLAKKIRLELAEAKGVEVDQIKDIDVLKGFDKLVRIAMKDEWIRKNMTSIGFIYRNFNKILGK